MHQLQSFALNLFYHYAQYCLLSLFVFWKEHKPCAVPTFLRYRNALQENELMRNLHHDAGTVARLVTRLCTTMLHVLQHLQCVVNKFMALASMNVHHHAHAAGIVFVCFLI